MADKHDKKAEAKPEGEAPVAKKGGLLSKLPVLLGGTMAIEAVLIIGVVKFLGVGSKSAKADTEIASVEGEKGASKTEGGESEKKGETPEGEKSEKGAKPAEGGGEKTEEKTDAKSEDKGSEKAEEKGKGEGKSKASKSPFVEVELTTFRAPNAVSGHRIVYDLSIFALVKRGNEEKMKGFVRDRKATVEDRLRTIIATLDPEKLGGGNEPGLETLRRQVKFALDEVVGAGVVEEVLISRCLPYRGE